MTSDLVKFIEHSSPGGRLVAEARLDSQATLNALRFIEHDHETGQLATFSHGEHPLEE